MIARLIPTASDVAHLGEWMLGVVAVLLVLGAICVVVQAIVGVVFGDDEVRL